MKTQVLMLFTLIVVFGCKCNKTNSKMETITPVLVSKGNLYGSGSEGITKQNMVIENQSDWEALMLQMDKVNKVSRSFSETEIDFQKSTVVAVFNGVKSSGGHSIAIDINPTSKNTLVNVKYVRPEGNASSVMTQPYYIAKIPKRDVPIVFQ